MIAKLADSIPNCLGGWRQGTALINRPRVFELFGAPHEDWRTSKDKDCKVRLLWHFITPRGPAELRDYWWNGVNEWSIAARNRKAALFLARHLRSLGVPASTRFNYEKDCKRFS